MSLLYCEGFDDGLAIDRSASRVGFAEVTTPVRTGTLSGRLQGAANIRWTFPAGDRHATFVVGLAFQVNQLPSTSVDEMIEFFGDDFSTEHMRIGVSTTGRITVERGDNTQLGQTDSGVIAQDVWYYLEVYITLSDTVGVVKIRVNGETPAGWSDLTSQDTKNGGTAVVFDTVNFRNENAFLLYMDDLYIFNGVASAGDNPNNDVIGDSAVIVTFPNGNGTTSQLDGSDGNQTDNFQLVDESTADSSDFTGSTSTGNLDTYAYGDVSTSISTIYGLIVSSWAAKSSAGNRGFATVVRTSADQSTSTGYALTTTYTPHDIVYETNPNKSTEEWTVTNVNAAQFGVVVTT